MRSVEIFMNLASKDNKANLANTAIPNKNDVLDILSHMVRPRNTHGDADDYFHEINSFL